MNLVNGFIASMLFIRPTMHRSVVQYLSGTSVCLAVLHWQCCPFILLSIHAQTATVGVYKLETDWLTYPCCRNNLGDANLYAGRLPVLGLVISTLIRSTNRMAKALPCRHLCATLDFPTCAYNAASALLRSGGTPVIVLYSPSLKRCGCCAGVIFYSQVHM